jgi:formylglycine-generating enzyme required for sulfatase activity
MIDVPAFAISKYPITNAQYAKFIEAGGYREQKWWTDDGWYLRTIERWTEPKHWQDKKWTAAEHPVDGVSWYESMAFCCWLSEVTGEKILLPTDQQWQWAALGDDGRKYPWGKDWDGTRCNNSVGSQLSMGTTPVRQYEGRGDSPFGVVDMVGRECVGVVFDGAIVC